MKDDPLPPLTPREALLELDRFVAHALARRDHAEAEAEAERRRNSSPSAEPEPPAPAASDKAED